MKKTILVLAVMFAFTASVTSCREVNEEKNEVRMSDDVDDVNDDLDDVADDVEEAIDDAGDAVEKSANEVEAEIRGTDDN